MRCRPHERCRRVGVGVGGRREAEEPGAERLRGELRTREVHAGEEDQRGLHQLAERLRRRRLAGLPRDQVAELVDVVGGARREQRHAERVRPLLLVVLAAEHRGVRERVAEHHPLGEVALRRGFLREERGEHRIAGEEHARDARGLQLRDHEPRVFLRGRDVERVRDGHRRLHVVRAEQILEVRDAPAERARVVVVVDDAEHALLRRELLRARVHGLALVPAAFRRTRPSAHSPARVRRASATGTASAVRGSAAAVRSGSRPRTARRAPRAPRRTRWSGPDRRTTRTPSPPSRP